MKQALRSIIFLGAFLMALSAAPSLHAWTATVQEKMVNRIVGLEEAWQSWLRGHKNNLAQVEEDSKCCVCLDDEKPEINFIPCNAESLHSDKICLDCLQRCMERPVCPICRTPFASEVKEESIAEPTGEYEVRWSGEFVAPGRPGYYSRDTGSGSIQEENSLRYLCRNSLDDLKNVSALAAEWKKFYTIKLAALFGGFLGYNHLKKSEKLKEWQDKWELFKKKHPTIAKTLKVSARASWFALAVVYPLYKFRKLFFLERTIFPFRSRSIKGVQLGDDDIHVFYRQVEVGRRYTDYGSEPIYEAGRPEAYMSHETKRKEFMPIRKANVMSALSAAASFASAYAGCVV